MGSKGTQSVTKPDEKEENQGNAEETRKDISKDSGFDPRWSQEG